MLRGIQLGVSQKWLEMTEDDMNVVKSWGLNTVEIHQARLDQLMLQNGTPNLTFISESLDPLVGWCEKAELNHIVNTKALCGKNTSNLYWIPWVFWKGAGYGSRPSGAKAMADISHKFWSPDYSGMDEARTKHQELIELLAERYKNNKYTMLGINNEPLHHTQKFQTDTLGKALGQGYSDIMTAEVNAVRDLGFSNMVMVDRPYTKSLDHFPGLEADANIEIHQYVSPGTKDYNGWKRRIDEKINYYGGLGHLPFIGEVGIDPVSYRLILPNYLATLDSQIHHLEDAPVVGYNWHAFGKLPEYTPDEQNIIDIISQFTHEPEPPTGKIEIIIPLPDGSKIRVKIDAKITVET